MSSLVPTESVYQETTAKVVDRSINTYSEKFADTQDPNNSVDKKEVVKVRIENAQTMTETFYDLVTDFYEYGYGKSFHFTPIYDAKSFEECIADYEKDVGKMIKAKAGMKILDIGCGVGGPGREIARTFGSSVVGINYNAYQIERAKKHTNKAKLDHLCSYVKGDFCNMADFEDNTFDGAFAFEATCHAKDLVLVYKEVCRTLKPGALFAEMTWCVTDTYDPQNPKHVKVVDDVMYGNSLPEARSQQQVLTAMREAGLEVVAFRDLVQEGDLPWYSILENHSCCSFKNFLKTTAGRYITHFMLGALETMFLMPKGTTKVCAMLEKGAISLTESGKMGVFTPMFHCLARKPLQ